MHTSIKRLVYTALLFAIGMILPSLTMGIPLIGNMLSPMHLCVMMEGLLCGPALGLLFGFLLPLTRSLTLGMPMMYPTAIAMAFEMAAYGFVIGILYQKMRPQSLKTIYISLICAMIIGRLIWGVTRVVLLMLYKTPFSFEIFITAGFLSGIPGIILQFILIPLLMNALVHAHIIAYKK